MNAEIPERDLAIRTKIFALGIIQLVEILPLNRIGNILGNQVLRSGTSIGANYREARRARSKAEFIAKIGECLKEADETAYWLELLSEGRVLAEKDLVEIQDETNQLIAIFVTTLKSAKAKP